MYDVHAHTHQGFSLFLNKSYECKLDYKNDKMLIKCIAMYVWVKELYKMLFKKPSHLRKGNVLIRNNKCKVRLFKTYHK